MSNRIKRWKFLWLEYERVGWVEELTIFGLTIYRRSGSVCELFGYHWIQK